MPDGFGNEGCIPLPALTAVVCLRGAKFVPMKRRPVVQDMRKEDSEVEIFGCFVLLFFLEIISRLNSLG